ncbi:GNAT family N-acetyltransferase [Phascolarctobacterium sp.]|uniref:GNAT family N-acetyltransferase n=1 Tax=Phascolarctobacterium sp. TaxID=2049039 RepID=UPI0034579012
MILKLVDQTGRIIGSIRAQKQEDSVYIGKLMVHPAYQRQGLGSRLLQEIERTVVGRRYELFTSSRSMRNCCMKRLVIRVLKNNRQVKS